jgi:predicted GH43/DUF377 family glycosyl hydrolase
MKWRKIGKIFDFASSDFMGEYVGFSQGPQALVFDDYVRIYFSTRKFSENGKYVSHIQYIDMCKNFESILSCSAHTVIKLGELGTFDEHGIFPLSVFRHNDEVWGYSNGWNRRKSVSVDTAIGLAISNDKGNTFNKVGSGPVLGPSLHEPYLVCDPFVRVFDNVFHMWYIYGTSWKIPEEGFPPERTYIIAHATSLDGVSWCREGNLVIPQHYPDECQAYPSVIKIGDKYHMYFCHRNSFDFRGNPTNSYKLGYAYSSDLVNWVRDDANSGIVTSESDWDSNMMCYPNIFECDAKFYLLYNGNEFGKYGFGIAELEQS